VRPTERAIKLWNFLVCKARDRQEVTYTDAAKAVGLSIGRSVSGGGARAVDRVDWYCSRLGLPELGAIVVRKDTCRPGRDYKCWETLRDQVFDLDWGKMGVPSEAELVPWAVCPTHRVRMERSEEDGEVWYSHIAEHPDTGHKFWCKFRAEFVRLPVQDG
jgi:hypothetical protein